MGIGQQGKGNSAPGGEELQDRLVVVADADEANAAFFKFRVSPLQLDQLPFAKRSPIGGTEEKNNKAITANQIGEITLPAKLIDSSKGGNGIANFQRGTGMPRDWSLRGGLRSSLRGIGIREI